MPDKLHKPEDPLRRETAGGPRDENSAEVRQPYTPANLNVDYGAPAAPGPPAADPHMDKYLPETASRSSRPRLNQNALNQTAEKIGALIGTTVNIFRDVERQLRSVPDNVVSIRERVRERSQEFRQDAADAAREWRQSAQAKAQQARERTAQYIHENPFQVIAAVAGVAFCVGAALRIWRSTLD